MTHARTASDPPVQPLTVWTLGHSILSEAEFLSLLHAYRIETLVDVRRYPGSRRSPQFHTDALARNLPAAGIAYEWLPSLGGRRRPSPDSVNTAWRSESFRGYADYTASEEFDAGLAQVAASAHAGRTAIMCSEVLWWRCHRALISDVLLFKGIQVLHILDATHCSPHPYSAAARVVDGELTYSAAAEA